MEPDTERLILPGEENSDGECDFSRMFEARETKASTVTIEQQPQLSVNPA